MAIEQSESSGNGGNIRTREHEIVRENEKYFVLPEREENSGPCFHISHKANQRETGKEKEIDKTRFKSRPQSEVRIAGVDKSGQAHKMVRIVSSMRLSDPRS